MLNRYSVDYGLLALRLGTGILFMLYGYPKLMGGPATWEKIGGAMSNIHIHFGHTFWGFMAAIAEFGGGLCLVLGFLFRPAVAMLIFTMLIAVLFHYMKGDGFQGYSGALFCLVVFIAMFISGPGKYALKITRR